MTIDERLDRLTERHEDLALAMELESREIEALRTSIAEFRTAADSILSATKTLLAIAMNHEARIQKIEDGPA